MSRKLNKCAVCGKEYDVCSICASVRSFTPWRTITDNINCYKIHMALEGYTNKYSTIEETKKALEELDLSEVQNFQDNIKKAIEDIMGSNTVKTESKKAKN